MEEANVGQRGTVSAWPSYLQMARAVAIPQDWVSVLSSEYSQITLFQVSYTQGNVFLTISGMGTPHLACVSGCSLVCGFSLCNLDVQTQHLCSACIIYHLYRAVTHRVNLGSVVSVPSADIRCPFCSKPFPGGRIEDHLLSCLTSPPLPYNSKYRATKILLQLCLLKGWWLNVRVFSYA